MKLALLGHGQMARVVEAQARAAGLDIGVVVTSRNAADAVRLLPGHTAAIDFSTPAAVIDHVTAAVAAGVPLVEGTTGWQDDAAEVRRIVTDGAGALIHGANFSIGVNLFYRLVANAAPVFRGVAGGEPCIEGGPPPPPRGPPPGTD